MAKKTAPVLDTPVIDENAQDVVVVLAPLDPLPAFSVDALIAALTNPDARAASSLQLDERIAARKAELEQLMMARRALEPQVMVVEPVTKTVKTETVTRTSQNSDHASAILVALKGEKTGLTLSDLRTKMTNMGHTMEQKNLASYVWSMTKTGKLTKDGPRGAFKYKATTSV